MAERYATTSADAAGVWIKLLESESVSERVEAALAWVRAFPDANGSFGVWGKVLLAEGFPIARSNEALDWIQNATSRAGIRPLLRQLISNSEGAVLDRAVETACQLLPEVDDRHRADFLAPLLSRLDPEHPRFASFHEAFCNLPTSGEKSNAAFEILRKLVRQRAPQPRIDSAIALCTNEAFAKRAIHHRAKLLAQMLEDPEFTTGVVETMIRLRDKGRQQPQTHSFLWSIANLTAFYASDAILAAASIRPPNEAEDLLIMLADSTIGDPKRRAAILALRQRWPRAHLDVFRRVERENPRQSRIQ